METTTFDTYGTAAPGFAQGVIALGNDAGILSVDSIGQRTFKETKETDVVGLLHFVAVTRSVSPHMFRFALRDWQQFAKIGSAFALVFAIAVVPDLSVKLADQTSPDYNVEWDSSWPNEWKDTQVIVFEINGTEHVIGGLNHKIQCTN